MQSASPGRRARIEWTLLLLLLLALAIGFGPLPRSLLKLPPTPDPSGSVQRPGPVDTLDLFLYDEALRRDRRTRAADIVIIDIDDDSLGQVGRWPWPRPVLAALIDRIAAARPAAVAVDILFTEPAGQAVADQALAESLQRLASRSRLILAVARMHSEIGHYLPLYPLPIFSSEATLAHAFFVTGADGLVRGLYLQEAGLPALSRALVDPGARPDRAVASAALSQGLWPTSEGRLLGASIGGFTRIPAAALLRGEVDLALLSGRRLLLGATAIGAGDQFATPLLINRVQASGVELHAIATSALLTHHLIEPMPVALHVAISVLVLVALMSCLWFTRPWAGLALTVGVVAGLLAATLLLFWSLGRWLQPSALLFACALAYPLWSWRRLTAASAGLFAQARRLERSDSVFPAVRRQRPREPISAQLIRVQDAAEQVETLNRFLMDTIQRLPHPVLVADDSHRVLLANERLTQTFKPAPVPGMPMLQWLGGALQQPELQSLNAPRELQGEFRDADGRYWMVDVSETGRGGRAPTRWLIQLVDITPLRLAEREREEALSFLSHDLRSPQAALLAMIDQARLRDDPGGALDLDEIERQARRTLTLTDGFLQFARADAKPMQWGDVDLEILVTEVADLAWFTASTRQVRVRAESPPDAIIRGDSELLRRALANLVENGIRHCRPGGEVRLGCHAIPGGWLLTIEDEGPGVPEAIREKIFRPFWQPTREEGPAHLGAAGLGLAMVSRCVDRHGGTIRVTDRADGPGARFEIRLPKQTEAIIPVISIA